MRFEWIKSFFVRRFIVLLMLALHICFFVYALYSGSRASQLAEAILTLISIAVVLHIVSSKGKSDYKLIWSIMILAFPIFGGLWYLVFKIQSMTGKYKKKQNDFAGPSDSTPDSTKSYSEHPLYRCITYLEKTGGFPAYRDTYTEYYKSGEEYMASLLTRLESAEHFIFLEYFIIEEGEFWDSILSILKRKASEGVDIRVIFDDIGSLLHLPAGYEKKLEGLGIKCLSFNKIVPVISSMQNNRDHRKIAVIDGKFAFTGGVNIADEYINRSKKRRLGEWKDCGIMLEGPAAQSFTRMFLQMWQGIASSTRKNRALYIDDPSIYLNSSTESGKSSSVLVQPYCDSPLDDDNVSEQVYLRIINSAKKYVYIFTPYLIIDENILSALSSAAKSGVDVRIVTPHKGDRRIIHATTRMYYSELTKSGVKVYEYKKGFIHSKMFVSDDTSAVIGTVNLDYRSMYLHFECGVLVCEDNKKCLTEEGHCSFPSSDCTSSTVLDAKNDFLQTLSVCKKIELSDCKNGRFNRTASRILRLFAPIM